MKILIRSICLLILFVPVTAKSQQLTQPDSLLNRMTGNWILNGTINGQKTTHDVEIQRVLNGQYVQLKEVSRERDQNGNPVYEALVYICWEESKKQYSCLWLDNTGNGGISNGITGHAKQNRDKIELIFRYNATAQFHTTFLYNRETDTWQWLMDEEEDGKTQPFARIVMTKKV
jgi:hypothetical protein